MKNEQLFEAIGGLDEAMIAETETEKRGKRIGWRVALVAAIVAGLGITAVASPTIRNALLGGKMETDDRVWITNTDPADGSSYEVNVHEITLEVEIDADAPKSIQTYYIPQIPENMNQIKGHIHSYDAPNALTQFWWISEGKDYDIFFSQLAGGSLRPEDLKESVTTLSGTVPKTQLCTMAGIQGYLIDVKPIGDGLNGDRIFFWSDGDYLFRLEVPYGYTDAQLEEMVASVQPVEDITPYLSTMTQEEINEAFG